MDTFAPGVHASVGFETSSPQPALAGCTENALSLLGVILPYLNQSGFSFTHILFSSGSCMERTPAAEFRAVMYLRFPCLTHWAAQETISAKICCISASSRVSLPAESGGVHP